MKWNVVGLAGLLSISAPQFQQYAEACGLKVTINTSKPRNHIVNHSANPTHVLVVGLHSRRLERDLSAAGHDVEVVPTSSNAKRDKDYAIVLVDPAGADDARKSFPKSTVIVESGDVDADTREVEARVARVAVRGTKGPDGLTLVAAGPKERTPVATATPKGPEKVGAKDKTEATAPTEAKPKEVATATPKTETKPAEPRPVEPKPVEPKPTEPVAKVETHSETKTETKPAEVKPKATKPSAFAFTEVYFTVGSSELSAGYKSTLKARAKWMADNADAQFAVEGYADPTGSADANMALSQARAESVRDFLVSSGVDSGRLEVRAFGSTKLKYGTTDGRNRRVQVLTK